MIYVLKVDSPIPTTDSETKVDLYHRISLRNPILRVRRAPLREHADPVTVSSEEAAIKEVRIWHKDGPGVVYQVND